MKKVLLALSFVVICGLQSLMAQTTEITGTVTDAGDGFPIPGISVFVKGTTVGTVTRPDGTYALEVPENAETLVFSFIGMSTQEILIEGRSVINVAMKSDAEDLDEVIVVAYGTAKKSSFTGSAGVVGAEELESRTVTSVTQALEGATTGVQVTSGSGQPGSSPEIRIRGIGTLNGTADPLFIVDGATYENGLENIDPNDIASMTILKDASSTALYGSRAANGVVLITTKKGKSGAGSKVNFNASAVVGVVTQAIPYYETANPSEYYELMFESYKNSLIFGKSNMDPADAAIKASAEIYDKLKYNPFNVANDQIVGTDGRINPNARVTMPGLNWYEPLEQTGKRQNYSVTANGGGENHDFMFSIGHLDETGYIVSSKYKRTNARMDVNVTPTKWLKLGTNIYGYATEKGLASGTTGNTSYGNPFYFARNMGPIYPVWLVDPSTHEYIHDVNGQRIYDLGGGYNEFEINKRPAAANPGRHIIAELDYNDNLAKTNGISNRSYATFNLYEGLSFTMRYSLDILNSIDSEFENEIVGDGAPTGRYSQDRFTRTTETFNQIVNYAKSFGEGHNFDFMVGHESYDRNYSDMTGMKTQMTAKGIYEYDNFVTPTDLSGYSSDYRLESYLGQLKYNYMDKYYFSASFRRDGSSRFHPDERWGNFYSVGASWRMDQEQFIQDISWIDQLKLRLSYGEVGNDKIAGYYAYQAKYGFRPNAGEPGLNWSDVGNTILTWETSASYDAALEFTLLNNRMHGSLEYYRRNSVDLLYEVPLALSQGLAQQPRNAATMANSGFEIGIGGSVIKTASFTWDIDLQMSTLKNEITEIPDPYIDGSKRWSEGHSVYDFFTYDYYGVNSETGAALFHVWKTDDKTGETVPQYNEDGSPVLSENYLDSEQGYTGDSSIPDLFGSIGNTLSYKDFRLTFLFTYGIGGKIMDYSYRDLMHEGEYGNAIHVDQLKGWRTPGESNDIPRLQFDNSYLAPTSDRWLTDASYLSFKNINLSYNFKQKFVSDLGIKSLRAFVTGENLFISTARKGMNPQQNFGGTTSNVYLPSRVFSIGVNVGF
ncbi:SusC/RagA family TonB-linked outer membrane protein [Carboxylicivirga sp. N1Y90]|uniref:SusC/RagA family TonB-linked outer membrane protein n=1 Tax=Carboxylicivirga fragile TaxID=3417571 RepID=UPI003D32B01B|nr:TonB-dependent receptor [Marinilabiliaceae bacterium N1Y90]